MTLAIRLLALVAERNSEPGGWDEDRAWAPPPRPPAAPYADYQIIAEWICCDPIRADHDLCSKGEAARKMTRSLLTDDPEFHPARSPVLDAVIAVVQPKLDAKDAEIAELRAAANPGNVELVRRLVHSYSRLVTIERDDARQRAEQAEDANARGLEVLRVWRDERTLEPQTARFLYEVGAALAQPGDQEGTTP